MLQRIQTVYMLLVFIISAGLPFVFPLWALANGQKVWATDNLDYEIIFSASAALSLGGIATFKKRQTQFVVNRLNIISNLILLGLFVYRTLMVSGETAVSEKGIGMFLPIASIVLLVLANKAIKKDEDLVKSVDRLR